MTAPDPGGTRLVELLGAAGHRPMAIPTVRIEVAGHDQLEQARDDGRWADLTIVTSARTVEVLWPDGGLDGQRVAAVGAATADAARSAGAEVVATGTAGVEALVREVAIRPRRVAYPRAAGGDPDRLRPLGGELRSTVVYDAVPIPASDEAVDGVLFASPSAVRGWTMTRGLDLFVGAIGPTTAAAVRDRDGAAVEADHPTLEALAATIPDPGVD